MATNDTPDTTATAAAPTRAEEQPAAPAEGQPLSDDQLDGVAGGFYDLLISSLKPRPIKPADDLD